jgi:SAM-dependent methyltransferase
MVEKAEPEKVYGREVYAT